MSDLLTRRRIVQGTAGLAAVGLAGCTGASTNDGATNGTPTESQQGQTETESGQSEGGHDDGGHGNEAIGAPTDTAEISMVTNDSGHHFLPGVVRVNVGGTVTWTNESGGHSTTAYHADNDQPQLVPDGATAWDSGTLSEQGATLEHTFETEGVYHYYCIPHETLGMIGSIIVGEPDPHEQVALEEPPADKPESVRKKITQLNEKVRTALGDDH
jgi:plastocyanin